MVELELLQLGESPIALLGRGEVVLARLGKGRRRLGAKEWHRHEDDDRRSQERGENEFKTHSRT
jgi:hypothetical protein